MDSRLREIYRAAVTGGQAERTAHAAALRRRGLRVCQECGWRQAVTLVLCEPCLESFPFPKPWDSPRTRFA